MHQHLKNLMLYTRTWEGPTSWRTNNPTNTAFSSSLSPALEARGEYGHCISKAPRKKVGTNLSTSIEVIVTLKLQGSHSSHQARSSPSVPQLPSKSLQMWAGIYSLSLSSAIVSQTNASANFPQGLTETSCTNFITLSETWQKYLSILAFQVKPGTQKRFIFPHRNSALYVLQHFLCFIFN